MERLLRIEHISNTTQSFCEHEADLGSVEMAAEEEPTATNVNDGTFILENCQETEVKTDEVRILGICI